MFSSLRSRLLQSYLLVIFLVLIVVTASLLVYLAQNPRFNREAESRLAIAANSLSRQSLAFHDREDLAQLVSAADENLDARVLVFNSSGETLADSRSNIEASFGHIPFSGQQSGRPDIADFIDENGREWLFIRRNLPGRFTLILATLRPTAPLLALFTDEFFLPLMRAGLLALTLSIVLAFLMARWIAGPLQGISEAANDVAQGKMTQIEPRGPKEVRNLSLAFNDMSRQVDASRQSIQDFVANVSHDLKTPLTSIHGFGQAILDGTSSSGKDLKQAANIIVNEADRMNRLVDELLDSARFDSGIAHLTIEKIQMSNILEDLAERISLKAKNAGVRIDLEIEDLPVIQGDEDRLTQVFSNLLDNAFKNTPEKGRILISGIASSSMLEITISDTGKGIPSHELKRVFERFYQVDKARSEGASRGFGLGLSIVRQIIEAHGGYIEAESVEGQGSRFIIKLPIS